MTENEQIFTLLQHGDSFFPSGAVSFSWGLEMLKDDRMITSINDVNNFIENQLLEKWGPFERVVLAHTLECTHKIDAVIAVDHLVECMTLTRELRDSSKKLGLALLTTYCKLDNPVAHQYRTLVNAGDALGHLPITQALVWNSIGLTRNSVLILSAYNFCVSVLSAALRLGIAGYIDCQRSVTGFRELIIGILTWPIPDLEHMHAFTPYAEIASMRHETADSRLFSN